MNLKNRIIKHTRNKDVCYDVLKCFDAGHKVKLKVEVLNMGYVESYRLNISINIVIMKEDYGNWHMCIEPSADCLRYVEWKRLV